AFVHGAADDVSGALAMYDESISIWEKIVEERGGDAQGHLAMAYGNKALFLSERGGSRSALILFGRAIKHYEEMHKHGQGTEFSEHLALDHMNKGNAHRNLGELRAALRAYENALRV